MMKKNELCVAAIANHNTWSQYWEGTLLRNNLNIGTLTRQTYLPMVGYGLSDRLNAFVSLPYVITSASGGQMIGQQGFSDLSISLKYRLLGGPRIRLHGSINYTMPSHEYNADYQPFSLGSGARSVSGQLIGDYKHTSGLYLRSSIEYNQRGYATAWRNYYYNGGSYYTDQMDVPNIVTYEVSIGKWWAHDRLQTEVGYTGMQCLSGDDIRRQNMPQPTNKTDMTAVKGKLRYFSSSKKWSVFGQYDHVITGRNVGQGQGITLGLTYLILKNAENH
jgi:hypothetical protein